MDSLSQITSLQQTLNTAIDAFKAELTAQKLPEPSLTTSKPHPIDDITYIPAPAMYEARRAALACLGLLKSLIQSPYDALTASTWSTLETAGVRLAAETGLSDILAAAPDPEAGLSITDVATKSGMDPLKLERVLRLLITQGWFREPKQGYFANNRLSNLIKRDQPGWHLSTYMNELFHRVSEKLPAHLTHPDPTFRNATDGQHTAWNLAYDTPLAYLGVDSWLTKNPSEALKFALTMGAMGPTSDPGIVADFPWSQVAKGKDAIIDVGGGQGTLCCSLAAKYPEIEQFVVQDLPGTREAAESFIASKDMLARVKFEAQDFFKPQQRKGKYVFVMQRVLHDWSTEDGAKMLAQIRDVLNPESTLLIIDTIILPGVTSPSGRSLQDSLSQMSADVYQPIPPPPFVPVNFGEASRLQHQVNMVLTTLCNSFERTLPQLKEMVELAGLKIKAIHATRAWVSIAEVVL